ncbi:hypothetical protein [Fusarium solani alternavirus 1]|nr:hypothetical protein [Fusarium solani alternavirus 1]
MSGGLDFLDPEDRYAVKGTRLVVEACRLPPDVKAAFREWVLIDLICRGRGRASDYFMDVLRDGGVEEVDDEAFIFSTFLASEFHRFLRCDAGSGWFDTFVTSARRVPAPVAVVPRSPSPVGPSLPPAFVARLRAAGEVVSAWEDPADPIWDRPVPAEVPVPPTDPPADAAPSGPPSLESFVSFVSAPPAERPPSPWAPEVWDARLDLAAPRPPPDPDPGDAPCSEQPVCGPYAIVGSFQCWVDGVDWGDRGRRFRDAARVALCDDCFPRRPPRLRDKFIGVAGTSHVPPRPPDPVSAPAPVAAAERVGVGGFGLAALVSDTCVRDALSALGLEPTLGDALDWIFAEPGRAYRGTVRLSAVFRPTSAGPYPSLWGVVRTDHGTMTVEALRGHWRGRDARLDWHVGQHV